MLLMFDVVKRLPFMHACRGFMRAYFSHSNDMSGMAACPC
jgi:hypothetical protein